MSYLRPVYLHNNTSPFIFINYSHADLVDFNDNYIQLYMNNSYKHLYFKILIDYDCSLITKKYDSDQNIIFDILSSLK